MELISYAAIHNMFQRSSFVFQRVARLCEGFWLSWSIKICASLCHWQCFISRLETWPWTSKAAARSGYDPWSADNWEILIVTIQTSAASPPEILLGEETVALGVVHAEGVLKHCVVLQGNLLLLLRPNYSFLLDWRLSSVINMIYTAFESKSDPLSGKNPLSSFWHPPLLVVLWNSSKVLWTREPFLTNDLGQHNLYVFKVPHCFRHFEIFAITSPPECDRIDNRLEEQKRSQILGPRHHLFETCPHLANNERSFA